LDLETETFTIDRSKSTTILGVNTSKEAAPHTLYIFKDELGNLSLETLDIRLFYDVSVLEVFVNERTAISTRLYPSSTICYGLKVFSEQLEDAEAPELRRFDFWDITL
jgi:beta-fructofuranosidase